MTSFSIFSILCLIIEGHDALLLQTLQRPVVSVSHRHHFSSRGTTITSLSASSSNSESDQRPPRRVKIRARTASKGSSSSPTLTRTKRKKTKSATTKTSASIKSTRKKTTKAATATTPKQSKAAEAAAASATESKEQEKEEELPPPKYYTRQPTIHTKSGAPWQHQEMMDHTILNKEEEFMYGRQVVRARELREAIDELLEEQRMEGEMRQFLLDNDENDGNSGGGGEGTNEQLDLDFLSYELEYLSVYGFRPSQKHKVDEFDLEDDLLIDHAQHRSLHMTQLRNNNDPSNNFRDGGPKRNGYRNGSSSSTSQRNSYTPLLHIPIHQLSESDVIHSLNIPGGKAELTEIFLEGAYARETLMRKNVKLVMSIAKNWMRNSFSTANANHQGNLGAGNTESGKGLKGDKSTKKYLAQMYEGSWDKPSLDEAVQEGMLGLARAVDKYDPERGLRFSTYATHWITSYVRVCFQRAVTGCLRVPSQLHDIKSAYNKIIRDALHLGSDPPEQSSIAEQLGITEKRLTTAIRATGSLVSVDAPVTSAGSGRYKGSMAGGDGSNSNELLILDTLKCAEPRPEDQVEISFLRQCLENAMATELTPYERDILRLRLGLDSGEGKTVREIVEISGGSISMSDVRTAERRAFKKLRSPTSVHTHNLLAYLDLAGADVQGSLRR